MNNENLSVIVTDHDEVNRIFFKNICKDAKIPVRSLEFDNGRVLMEYLSTVDAVIPGMLFMNYHLPGKESLNYLNRIKSDPKFSELIVVIYSPGLTEEQIEEIFIKGGNVFMKLPGNYQALKKLLLEVVSASWQYHTSALSIDTFIMRVD
ncbi:MULTISPECIES: response regulator [Chryseobacterium]|uniref:Response regulator RpfG family c-di-GMP phosphodiesterase n=1 Tax=Chryseobacterium camelliae TaxID=1265445 RepID=A0ABU0TD76_9FLAO|nr:MULTISPECIES: response regulator [Chryseobacterium]MDT3407178.1 response regulator RpfG family c-di-GMP phosphodiesterase [Pseudacidovorax intermedius]MDQ1095032.1 response regulator RpfG family c-di-GMP phosphodiesterase [Chryseobacterium camelliae]MDQ1098971.1 response regulator RpfG family c-di-GMP phosphodiesterase [Chryseobacterium sp. SORGH_AS_1048]MDR6086319.1 response regulator RpfG family c-di-GMP phosphodiesterase [Chryseobacterium sp. SORGH_AS_0909]MDR6130691.1 response regulator